MSCWHAPLARPLLQLSQVRGGPGTDEIDSGTLVCSTCGLVLIPVSNYVGANTSTNPGLSLAQRYQWAVMDTFDMFAPAYDQPLTEAEARAYMAGALGEIHREAALPLSLSGRRM